MSHAWPCSGWGLPSRPGHPGRWCALTAPFHPYLCGPEPAIGGLFSVALSCGSPRLAVSQHPALWSPDLPRPGPATEVRPGPRSPGRLTVATSVPGDGPGAASLGPGAPGNAGRWPAPSVGCAAWRPARRAGGPTDPDALSIAELYDQVDGGAQPGLPPQPAASGCAARSRASRTAPATATSTWSTPTAAASARPRCSRSSAGSRPGARSSATLRREGIELPRAWWCVLRGSLDFYRARAEVSFILAELDVTALLGRLAAQRAALLRALAAEGLLERTAPGLPRRAPAGRAWWPAPHRGLPDFLGQLEASGFAFDVPLVPAAVQGPRRPGAIARALRVALARAGARPGGGGPRRGLQGRSGRFDAEPVARAIATMRRCRSGPASATPATSRWPTSWPTAPSSPPPSAGRGAGRAGGQLVGPSVAGPAARRPAGRGGWPRRPVTTSATPGAPGLGQARHLARAGTASGWPAQAATLTGRAPAGRWRRQPPPRPPGRPAWGPLAVVTSDHGRRPAGLVAPPAGRLRRRPPARAGLHPHPGPRGQAGAQRRPACPRSPP